MKESLPFRPRARLLRMLGDQLIGSHRLAITETSYGPALDKVFSTLAFQAVGKKNVKKDILAAINLSLHGILFYEISSIQSSSEDEDIWKKAVSDFSGKSKLTKKQFGQLNKKTHIADKNVNCSPDDRGAVIPLPDTWKNPKEFINIFGMDICDVGREEFKIPEFEKKNFDKINWIILQVQAACDNAQKHPGPLPYLLGMEIPLSVRSLKNKTPLPGHVWRTGVLNFDGIEMYLAFNLRFAFSVSPQIIKNLKPTYRIRQDMVNSIIYHLHTHNARPGMILF